jgi:hypothetical protein
MNSSSSNKYEYKEEMIINGGPYLVETNQYGAVKKEYGWASLHLINDTNHTHIRILCNDNSYNISDLCVHQFIINKINIDDELTKIHRSLRRGFNAIFIANFSKLELFKEACENYFNNL